MTLANVLEFCITTEGLNESEGACGVSLLKLAYVHPELVLRGTTLVQIELQALGVSVGIQQTAL